MKKEAITLFMFATITVGLIACKQPGEISRPAIVPTESLLATTAPSVIPEPTASLTVEIVPTIAPSPSTEPTKILESTKFPVPTEISTQIPSATSVPTETSTPIPPVTLVPTETPTTEPTIAVKTPVPEPTVAVEKPPQEFIFLYDSDEELRIAYEAGFVPQTFWNNMDKAISLADFSNIILRIVKETDSSKVSDFEEYLGTATVIEKTIDRSLASIVLYYGTYVLEIPERTWFSFGLNSTCYSTWGSHVNEVIGDRWDEEFKWKHQTSEYKGVFPKAEEGGYAWGNFWNGDVGASAYFTMLGRSTYDGRMYFDYDSKANSMHMDYTVSVEEAIRAATRFYVICHQKELFAKTIQECNLNSPHKTPIENCKAEDIVADMTIGIHFSQAQTDWLKIKNEGYIEGYDNFYDKIFQEWEANISRDKQRALLAGYREKGFNTIRLAVTWTPYIDPVTNKIDEGFLDYVEYYVNMILDEGMYCIIDSHRDFSDFTGTVFLNNEPVKDWMEPQYKDAVDTRFADMWEQIAEQFKDYNEYVILEALNEPSQSYGKYLDRQTQKERVNELNQIFVDTVRKTGSNNAKRTLAISCFRGIDSLDALIPPEDDNLITSIHPSFLTEWNLTELGFENNGVPVNEKGEFLKWPYENPTFIEWVEFRFDQVKEFEARTGVPVIVGEAYFSSMLTEEENLGMTSLLFRCANEVGAPVIFWDSFLGEDENVMHTSLYIPGTDTWGRPDFINAVIELASQRKR